jgi:hypothetical protein
MYVGNIDLNLSDLYEKKLNEIILNDRMSSVSEL